MTKIARVGSRGTSRRNAEIKEENWTGKAYKDVMKERKDKAKNAYVTIGRGTKTIKLGDITETSGRPTGKGRYVSTGRGTGRRKVQ